MATLTLHDNTIRIGADFVDAMTGTYKSHGALKTNRGIERKWQSTYPIAESEKALREAAKQDGSAITYFMSQAL